MIFGEPELETLACAPVKTIDEAAFLISSIKLEFTKSSALAPRAM